MILIWLVLCLCLCQTLRYSFAVVLSLCKSRTNEKAREPRKVLGRPRRPRRPRGGSSAPWLSQAAVPLRLAYSPQPHSPYSTEERHTPPRPRDHHSLTAKLATILSAWGLQVAIAPHAPAMASHPFLALSLTDVSTGTICKYFTSLQADSIPLGRGARANDDCQLPTSGLFRSSQTKCMSQKHAELSWDKGQYAFLKDVGSTNGTFVEREGAEAWKLKAGIPYRVSPVLSRSLARQVGCAGADQVDRQLKDGDKITFGKIMNSPDGNSAFPRPPSTRPPLTPWLSFSSLHADLSPRVAHDRLPSSSRPLSSCGRPSLLRSRLPRRLSSFLHPAPRRSPRPPLFL